MTKEENKIERWNTGRKIKVSLMLIVRMRPVCYPFCTVMTDTGYTGVEGKVVQKEDNTGIRLVMLLRY